MDPNEKNFKNEIEYDFKIIKKDKDNNIIEEVE